MTNFNELINSDQPVLVDFYTTWCGPCKTVSETLDQLRDEYGDRVTILKVDVDENPSLAVKYLIRSVPTLMTFRSGEILQTVKGFQGKAKIEDMIKGMI